MARMRADKGYTLVEILVTISLMSTLMAIGVGGFRHWALTKDHEGAAADMQTVLRQTQTRAITEGVTFCVNFDTGASEFTVWRYTCAASGVKVSGPFPSPNPKVKVRDPKFSQTDGTYSNHLLFKPTGTATPGVVAIRRDGSDKVYLVRVEGFTGRVSVS